MPKFLLERTWGQLSEDKLAEYAKKGLVVRNAGFPDIQWEHSHVVTDDDGTYKTFCVYTAPNAERLLKHADNVGGHPVDRVDEIGGTVSPEDFPTR